VPGSIAPQLATLVRTPPQGEGWVHEPKLDGYRILAQRVGQGGVTLWTRGGQDWTHRMPAIAGALAKAMPDGSWLDGEVVVLDEAGVSSFQKLQGALGGESQDRLVYFVFDLLVERGTDLRPEPLCVRTARLRKLARKMESTKRVFVVPRLEGRGEEALGVARKARFEGIVSKREDAPYHAGRNPTWQKTKIVGRQEFVVCGFTPPGGARSALGALLLGVHARPARRGKPGRLVYAGKVGAGFSEKSLRELAKRAKALRAADSPFEEAPPGSRDVTWLLPELVAEVEYTEWTRDGRLRHPVFKGLRADKKASEVVDERLSA
jgi:bifunctional non-homologous end joining protein LigD